MSRPSWFRRSALALDDRLGSKPEKVSGSWSDRFTPTSRNSLSNHQRSVMGQIQRFPKPRFNGRYRIPKAAHCGR